MSQRRPAQPASGTAAFPPTPTPSLPAAQPLATYDLRRRRYLGPTSMDTEMAFLMCNMAQVRFSID